MLTAYDDQFYSHAITHLAGVDEAGRGPLAGPVVAAAVVLPHSCRIEGLRDSKQLTEKARERYYAEITERALAWSVGMVTPERIDAVNILQASLIAMKEAVLMLSHPFDLVLVDGRFPIPFSERAILQEAVIRGDGLSAHIAAASVVAKVTRDRIMRTYHEEYPHYNFARNKGYPTLEHRTALKRHGPCPIHRRTFSGVRELVDEDEA
ncbi:MAG: ribonuclease HII [Deltaproteobacteria bacterium]|nr:ribonuclease HII [Candidatus Zymogenaceae bacterium]